MAHSPKRDPVCGAEIDPTRTPYRSYYQNKEYGFCSAECMTEFELQPQQYVNGRTMFDPGA